MLNDSLGELFKGFEFTKNLKLLLICRAIYFRGLFFPLLKEWGILDRKAIAVIYEDDYVAEILSQVFSLISDPIVFSINEAKRSWQKKLIENGGDIIIFKYGKGPQADDNIRLLNDLLQTGHMESEPINALPIVCYRGLAPIAQRKNYFSIRVARGEIAEGKIQKLSDEAFEEIMSFAMEKQEVFKWEVTKFFAEAAEDCGASAKKALMAAAVICKVFLSELYGIDRAEDEFKKMLDAIEVYSERDEEEQDGDGIGDVFISRFRSETESFSIRVYDKNAVALDYCSDYRYVIYDEKYYYIEEEFLKKICTEILETVGIGIIKNQLTEEKIIIPNHTLESFTVKAALCFSYGNIERKRLVRLDREKFDRPGVPDLTVRGEEDGRVDDREIEEERSICATMRY